MKLLRFLGKGILHNLILPLLLPLLAAAWLLGELTITIIEAWKEA